MAKKNKKNNVQDPRLARYQPPQDKPQVEPFFWTQDGRKVHIRTISYFDVKEAELNIRSEYEDRTRPPTYKTTTAGGTVKEHDLNEKILIVDGDQAETERRQAAWQEYKNAIAEMEKEISKTTLSLVFEGIDEIPEEGWIEKRKKRHLSIPSQDADEDDQLLFWKTAVLLKNNVTDIITGQTEIMTLALSGVATREEIEAAGSGFLGELSGQGNEESDSTGRGDQNVTEKEDSA